MDAAVVVIGALWLFILLWATRRRVVARLFRLSAPRFAFSSERFVVDGAEGARLAVRVYRPRDDGPFPVVVVRTPYGIDWRGGPPALVNHLVATMFAERGFVVVEQSARGRFASTGEFVPFVYERDDGRLLLDWVARQPWCVGPVGLYGQSYAGYTAWSIADDPRVGAVTIVQSSAEFGSIIHADGSLALESALRFLHVMEVFGGERSPSVWRGTREVVRQTARVHPPCDTVPPRAADVALVGREDVHFRRALDTSDLDDPFWRAIDRREQRDHARAPVLLVAGFLDPFVRETVRDFRALVARAHPARLVFGPWTHGALDARYLEEIWGFLRAALTNDGGIATGVRVVGHGLDGLEAPTWPPPSTPLTRALDAELALRPAAERAGVVEWTYDPRVPTPNLSGAILDLENAGVRDNRVLESRADVRCFTEAPLVAARTIRGDPTVTLHLSSTAASADVFVRLLDVAPDGASRNVTDGFIHVEDEALAGDGRTLSITLWPCAHTFPAGHRVRLLVASSAHPRWVRNPGAPGALSRAETLVPATMRLHLGGATPAHLVLPVVDDGAREGPEPRAQSPS